MSLPAALDRASPADSDNPSAGAANIRAFKLFVQDIWGISDATNYTVAPFAITTAGVVTVAVAGLKFQDGTAAAPSCVFSGATTTGFFRDTTNVGIGFSVAGAQEAFLSAAAFGPSTSDGLALGTTALMWADLFLASGAVVNFNNGNVTLTHAAGVLTLAGANWVVSGAGPHAIGGATVAGATLSIYTTSGETFRVVEGAGWSIDGSGRGIRILGTSSDSLSLQGAVNNTIRSDFEQVEIVVGSGTAARLSVIPRVGTGNGATFQLGNDADDEWLDIGWESNTTPRLKMVGTANDRSIYVIAKQATTVPFVVRGATSQSADLENWELSTGAVVAQMAGTATATLLQLTERNLGNDTAGPALRAGRNSSAGAVGQSAGTLSLMMADGNLRHLWSDASGLLRIHTAAPTGSSGVPTVSDTAGDVVGGQSSWHEAKDILRQWDDPTKALETLLATKVYDFRYKESSYLDVDDQPAVFTGIVGFDRRDWFLKNLGRQQIPSLNEINLHGFTVLSIQALDKRLRAVEAQK